MVIKRQSRRSLTPARVYASLCASFRPHPRKKEEFKAAQDEDARRQPGELELTEEEFKAAQDEYVWCAVSAWLNRPVPRPDHQQPTRPTRLYIRQARKPGLFANPNRYLDLLNDLHRAEFVWIILQGETKGLKVRRAAETVRERYKYLPQVNREDWPECLQRRPFSLACEEVAPKYGLTPESFLVLRSPSQRGRAGLPGRFARFLQLAQQYRCLAALHGVHPWIPWDLFCREILPQLRKEFPRKSTS